MSTFNLTILIAVFIVVTIVIVSFAFPGEAAKRKEKKKERTDTDGKDWESVALKLEKHILSLRADIERLNAEQRKNLKELNIEKEKSFKLQEKLSQEKEWFAKEGESLGKKDAELRELKQGLLKAEEDLAKEYSFRLKLEHEIKDLKQDSDALSNEKRNMALQVQKLGSEAAYYKKELADQKKMNSELKKESSEASWVAKAEYDKLEKLLREKEKELERISRNSGG